MDGTTGEHLADGHFTRGEFEAAAAVYATCEPYTDQIRAKRGWCLAVLDRFDEAEELLTPATCGTSSAELAVLAAIVAGGWNRNKLYAVSGTEGDDVRARSDQVSQLVDRALRATDKPDYLAFIAYKDLIEWYRDREAALVVAERAVSLFKAPDLAEWHARLLRWLGRPTNAALDALLEQMPEAPWSTFVAETFESALALSRYDDACAALDVLDEKLRSEQDSTFPIGLALMRSYVDLRRALDADPGAAVRGLAAVEHVSGDLPATITRHSWTDGPRLFADKLRLALAVIVKDERAVRESAKAIVDRSWAAESSPDYPLSCETIFVGGLEHGAEFGGGYRAPEVAASLSPNDQVKWTLLSALHAVLFEDESHTEASEYVSAHGPGLAPAWAARIVAETLLDSEDPDAHSVGLAITRHCLHAERMEGSDASPPQCQYDGISVDQLSELVDGVEDEFSDPTPDTTGSGWLLTQELGSFLCSKKAFHDLKRLTDLVLARTPGDADTLFYGALSRQELKYLTEASSMYEQLLKLDPGYRSAYWNITLIHEVQANPEAIEEMLPVLEERAAGGGQKWIEVRDRALAAVKRARQQQATTDIRAFARRELATYPPLREGPVDAAELSLLEAAGLVALLRASDLDHSAWTLAPFDSSSTPFEPTNRFRSALLDLARKGIIRIAESTPADAFTAKEGRLHYYLGRVHWSISPRTLALQREIRDMAKADWPAHWSAHAEVLSRDVATEECVEYM